MLRKTLAASILLASVAACGDDDDNATPDAGNDAANDVTDAGDDAGDDAGADTADVEADVPPPPPAPEGTQVFFDFEVAAGNQTTETWFDFPFPADVRLDDDGTLNTRDLPNEDRLALYTGLTEAADQLVGNSMTPVAWFRFDGEVTADGLDTPIAAAPTAAALLINIDAESDSYLELAPLVTSVLPDDKYAPSNVLAVGVHPGWVLDPDTTYAFVLTRAWRDAAGEDLGVPEALWNMAHGASSGDDEIDASYAPLWPALDAIDVEGADVAAATVFTTGDPVASIYALSERIRDAYDLTIDNLAIDADDGADHERFCELHGTMTVPEFQEGTPPFNTGGLFVFDDDGMPIEQFETDIPVVVTLPNTEMPADGFPLVLYFHGSGGLSTQVVDRGDDGEKGTGPSHVLAAHGFATAGSAHPVNPERLGGVATGFDYLNLANLKSFRDTFRQGIIEQRLYIDALLDLRVSPATVEGCDGLTLPDGADAFFFDPEPILAMGQSMGGMFTNIMAPAEPRIEAVVPTGAGGLWSYFILETSLIPGARGLLEGILRVNGLTHVHPTLHMLQVAWEPVEPFVFVPRLAQNPLPGHPARSIYEPVGENDSYFPEPVFDGIALAYQNQQAGDEVWTSMQQRLALRGLDGFATYPVSDNRQNRAGDAYTGVVVQWAFDGVHDGHNVFQYFDDVKHQYGCFFETYYRTGTAVVPAPAALGTPCDGLE